VQLSGENCPTRVHKNIFHLGFGCKEPTAVSLTKIGAKCWKKVYKRQKHFMVLLPVCPPSFRKSVVQGLAEFATAFFCKVSLDRHRVTL